MPAVQCVLTCQGGARASARGAPLAVALLATAIALLQWLAFALSPDAAWGGGVAWLAAVAQGVQGMGRAMGAALATTLFIVAATAATLLCTAVLVAGTQAKLTVSPAWHRRLAWWWWAAATVGYAPLGRLLLSGVESAMDTEDQVFENASGELERAAVGVPLFVALTACTTMFHAWAHDVRFAADGVTAQGPWAFSLVMNGAQAVALLANALLVSLPGARLGVVGVLVLVMGVHIVVIQPFYWHTLNMIMAAGLFGVVGAVGGALSGHAGDTDSAATSGAVWGMLVVAAGVGMALVLMRRKYVVRMAREATDEQVDAPARPTYEVDLMTRLIMEGHVPVGVQDDESGAITPTAGAWATRVQNIARVRRILDAARGDANDIQLLLVELNFLLTWTRSESTNLLVAYRRIKAQVHELPMWLVGAFDTLERERRAALIEAVGETSSEFQRDLRGCQKLHQGARDEIVSFWKVLLRDDGDTSTRLSKAAVRVEAAVEKATRRYERLIGDYPSLSSAQRAFAAFTEEILSNPDEATALFRRADGYGDSDTGTDDVSDENDAYSLRSGGSSHVGGVSVAGIAKRRASSIISADDVDEELKAQGMPLSSDSESDQDGAASVHAPTVRTAQTTTTGVTTSSGSSGRFASIAARAANRKYRQRLDDISDNDGLYMALKTALAMVSMLVLAIVVLTLSLDVLARADKEVDALHTLALMEASVYTAYDSVRTLLVDRANGDVAHLRAARKEGMVALAAVRERMDQLLFDFDKNEHIRDLLHEEPFPVTTCVDGTCTNSTVSFTTVAAEVQRFTMHLFKWDDAEWDDPNVTQRTELRYVLDNTLFVLTEGLEELLFLYEELIEDSINDEITVQWGLVSAAVAILVLLGAFLFRPAIAKYRESRVNVTNMFLSIPMARVREILDALDFENKAKAKKKKKKHSSKALRRIDDTSLQSDKHHTQRYLGALTLVAILFIIGHSVRITLSAERKDIGNEITLSADRCDLAARVGVLKTEFLLFDAQTWGTIDALRDELDRSANKMMYVHTGLLHGNETLRLGGSAGRHSGRHHLLFEERILIEAHGETFEYRGVNELMFAFRDEAMVFSVRPHEWTPHSLSSELLTAIAERLDVLLEELTTIYIDEDSETTSTLRAVEGGLFAALMGALLLALFVSFRPLVQQVKREGNRMRSLLLLIPADIVSRLEVVRDFLEAEGSSVLVNTNAREGVSQTTNIMEASHDAYVVSNDLGIITFFNDAATEMFGYEREEVIGQNVTMLMPRAMGARHDKIMENAAKRRVKGTVNLDLARKLRIQKALHKDGHVFPVMISLLHIAQHGVPHVVAVMRDAAEQAEDMESKQKAFMCDSAADVIVSMDERGVIHAANRAAAELFRMPADEMEGAAIDKLVRHERQGAHGEDDGELLDTSIVQLMRSNSIELLGVRSDGTTFPLEISSAEAERAGETTIVSILRDCSERKAAADDLIKANQLRAASNAKSAFLANMSHEIRTPLNGIIGMNQMILEDPELPDQAREYAEVLSNSADSLLVIVNDILDLSKLDAGKVKLEETDMEVTRLVEEVVMSNMGKVAGSNVTLSCVCMPSLVSECTVLGDPTRVTQVLNNLISNSVKFTQTGYVRVTARKVRETASVVTVVVDVEDTGIGMTEQQQKSLFGRFAQADESTTRKFGGTGLGLSISKQLVDMMGGSIEVKSRIGHGSTFSVEFPFTKSASTQLVRALSPDNQLAKAAPRMLLLCDDESTTKVLLAYLRLYLPNAHTFAVASRHEANDAMRRHKMDVLYLPESEVVHAIKQKWAPSLGVVAMRMFTEKPKFEGPPRGLACKFFSLTLPVRKAHFRTVQEAVLQGQAPPPIAHLRSQSTPSFRDQDDDSGSGDELHIRRPTPPRPPRPQARHASAVGPRGDDAARGIVRLRDSAPTDDEVSLPDHQSLSLQRSGSVVSLLSSDEESPRPASPSLRLDVGHTQPPRVLIVEDQKINQKVLTSILRKADYLYDVANNGQEGLDRFTQEPAGYYVCVLMDCQMPVMDGYTAARCIRDLEAAEPERGHIPIIAVTAHAMEGEKQKVLDAGMDMFQTKPYRKNQLLKLLEKVCATASDHSPPSPVSAGPMPSPGPRSVLVLVPEEKRAEVGPLMARGGAHSLVPHGVEITLFTEHDVARAVDVLRVQKFDLIVAETLLARQLLSHRADTPNDNCVVIGMRDADEHAVATGRELGMEAVCKWPRTQRAWSRLVLDCLGRE